MNYEEHPQNENKSNTGLIVTIACALLIVAIAAWFAISRYNKGNTGNNMTSEIKSDISSIYSDIESSVSKITSDIKSEYDNNVSSYNDDTVSSSDSKTDMPTSSAKPTNDDVSSVPYSANAKKPVEGKIIKNFSSTELQYSKTLGDMRLHCGIDIACKKGEKVIACADGKVLTVEKNSQYGNVITIEHGTGITAKYCSLDDIKVKEGDNVKCGDVIGIVAVVPIECDDESHLHFEVLKNGTPVSPLETFGLK